MVCCHLFGRLVALDCDPDFVIDFDLFLLLLLCDFTFVVCSVFLLCVLQHSFDDYWILWEAYSCEPNISSRWFLNVLEFIGRA